jgi:DNA-binding MarR family transcriptional regulator
MDTDIDLTEFPTPALMRSARGVYAQAIRAELHAIGIDDLPKNGAVVLAGIGTAGGPTPDLPSELGVTKQAVSLLIDTLVHRGYIERGPNHDDRRRVQLKLTDRGQEVMDAVGRAVDAIDHRLEERVSHEQVDAMRAGLIALTQIKTTDRTDGTARPRPTRELRRFSPIFPVRDLPAALAHYTSLGFKTFAYDADYGFADRDGVGLHLAAHSHHDPAHEAASVYLYVRDADALHAAWSQPGIGGRTGPVQPTPYKLREGFHIDPDGNLIRFGSPMEEER